MLPYSFTLSISPLVMTSILRSMANRVALAEIGVRRDAAMISAVKACLLGVNMSVILVVIDR